MKNLLLAVLVTVFAVALTAQCAPTLLVGSLVTVNGTTNSVATAALTYNPTLQQFQITHGALPSTNAMTLTMQITVDQTNYVNIGTWNPSSTNATTETINPNRFSITNYVRVSVTTTNSYTVGGSYGS